MYIVCIFIKKFLINSREELYFKEMAFFLTARFARDDFEIGEHKNLLGKNNYYCIVLSKFMSLAI